MMFSSGPISQREVGLARHHRIGYHCVAQGPGGLDAGWYPIPVGVQMQPNSGFTRKITTSGRRVASDRGVKTILSATPVGGGVLMVWLRSKATTE